MFTLVPKRKKLYAEIEKNNISIYIRKTSKNKTTTCIAQ